MWGTLILGNIHVSLKFLRTFGSGPQDHQRSQRDMRLPQLEKNESPKIAEVATIVIRAFLPHRVQRHSVDEVVSIRLYYCSFSVFALWPRCFLQRSPHKIQHWMGWTDRGMIIRNTADFQSIFRPVAPVVLMPWAVADQNWTQHGQIVGRFQHVAMFDFWWLIRWIR